MPNKSGFTPRYMKKYIEKIYRSYLGTPKGKKII